MFLVSQKSRSLEEACRSLQRFWVKKRKFFSRFGQYFLFEPKWFNNRTGIEKLFVIFTSQRPWLA